MSFLSPSAHTRGLFFILGGIILLMISLEVYAPFFRLFSILFSVLLLFLGLMDGVLVKAVYKMIFNPKEKYDLDTILIHNFFLVISGILLLLHGVGILEELFHSLLAIAGMAVFMYGLKESSILAKISQKIKEYEARKKE